MRYYFYCALLIITGILISTTLPILLGFTDQYFISLEIPQNNSEVAGVQKYNIPPVSKNLPVPQVFARAILVKDLNTETILYQKNPNISFPIASTTKIMTALVATEYYKQGTVLTVSNSADISGSKVG